MEDALAVTTVVQFKVQTSPSRIQVYLGSSGALAARQLLWWAGESEDLQTSVQIVEGDIIIILGDLNRQQTKQPNNQVERQPASQSSRLSEV